MNHFRQFFIALALVALLPIAAQALIQSQRDQIGVSIFINVTPNPLAYHAAPAHTAPAIIGTLHLVGAPRAVERQFEAQQLHFTDATGSVVAQTSAERSVKVEASIAPNPLATLLYSDQPEVDLNVEAGVSAKFPCAYHVTVHTTQTSWTLKHGLSNDFSDGSGDAFVGGDVANDSYISTPLPTSTPFDVYSTDGSVWANLGSSSGVQTYCVDLTINVPMTTPQGRYNSNAIYTLYY